MSLEEPFPEIDKFFDELSGKLLVACALYPKVGDIEVDTKPTVVKRAVVSTGADVVRVEVLVPIRHALSISYCWALLLNIP